MDRKIKFRIWDKKTSKLLYPYLDEGIRIFTVDGYISLLHSFQNSKIKDVNTCWLDYADDDIAIQQFTSIKDKNGREIYEGDIVKYVGKCDITYNKPGIVSIGEYFTHGKEFCHFGVRAKRLDMKNAYFGLSNDSNSYLIIGNILENPDLVKNES